MTRRQQASFAFYPSPALSAEQAAAFEAMLRAAHVPRRRPRLRTRAAIMAALATIGEARLTAAPAPAPASARWIVRIWYVSEGNETLACDSAPMGCAAADTLASACRTSHSMALAALAYRATDDTIARSGIVGCNQGSRRVAGRLVILPSQHTAPTVAVTSDDSNVTERAA